ncbi:MAG: hypothetical protein IPM67_07040 [Sphingomonadales bacterium]|nr:hypothetical protein [Sphingomonadales bacterium]MBK9268400.1 hypothetical protein [Sphingomonadales bacterium]
MQSVSIMLASVWLTAAMQSSATIEQVPPASDVPMERSVTQENAPNRKLNVDDTAQLGGNNGAPGGQVQLTAEKSGKEVDQLGKRDRNPQSTQNLSDRRQGFDTRVVKLEGTDRCSAELLSSQDREYCQRIIENRSAEYTGPREIELSPEQELLAKRNPKLIDGGTDAAIKRLTTNRNSSDDADSQAIASTVLAGQGEATPTAGAQPAENNLSAETQALIDAIVKNVSGNPGP